MKSCRGGSRQPLYQTLIELRDLGEKVNGGSDRGERPTGGGVFGSLTRQTGVVSPALSALSLEFNQVCP
jgi:hypothetical protein